MTPAEIVLLANAILASIGIIYNLYIYKSFKEVSLIAPLSWLINLLCFIIYRTIIHYNGTNPAEAQLLNMWSLFIQTHGAILLIFYAYLTKARKSIRRGLKEKR